MCVHLLLYRCKVSINSLFDVYCKYCNFLFNLLPAYPVGVTEWDDYGQSGSGKLASYMQKCGRAHVCGVLLVQSSYRYKDCVYDRLIDG